MKDLANPTDEAMENRRRGAQLIVGYLVYMVLCVMIGTYDFRLGETFSLRQDMFTGIAPTLALLGWLLLPMPPLYFARTKVAIGFAGLIPLVFVSICLAFHTADELTGGVYILAAWLNLVGMFVLLIRVKIFVVIGISFCVLLDGAMIIQQSQSALVWWSVHRHVKWSIDQIETAKQAEGSYPLDASAIQSGSDWIDSRVDYKRGTNGNAFMIRYWIATPGTKHIYDSTNGWSYSYRSP